MLVKNLETVLEVGKILPFYNLRKCQPDDSNTSNFTEDFLQIRFTIQ